MNEIILAPNRKRGDLLFTLHRGAGHVCSRMFAIHGRVWNNIVQAYTLTVVGKHGVWLVYCSPPAVITELNTCCYYVYNIPATTVTTITRAVPTRVQLVRPRDKNSSAVLLEQQFVVARCLFFRHVHTARRSAI